MLSDIGLHRQHRLQWYAWGQHVGGGSITHGHADPLTSFNDSIRHLCLHANWYVYNFPTSSNFPTPPPQNFPTHLLRTFLPFCAGPENNTPHPGNTIFVGLGASTQNIYKPYGWAKSLTSIICFVLGAFFFSRFCRLLGPLRRSTLVASFLLQSVLIFIPAALIQAGVIASTVQAVGQPIDWKEEIPIALLSFQSAGQLVGSRNLNLSEIPTVVVTSMLYDIASDPELASPLRKNVKRNRRALAFTGILVGAIIGGWISKVTGGMQTVLWIAGGMKILIMSSWMLWPEK